MGLNKVAYKEKVTRDDQENVAGLSSSKVDYKDTTNEETEKNQESKKRDQQDACKKSEEKFTDQKVSSEQVTRENKDVADKVEAPLPPPPLNSKSAAASVPKTCSTTKSEETDAKKCEKFTDQKVSAAGQETCEKNVVGSKTCSTTKTAEIDAPPRKPEKTLESKKQKEACKKSEKSADPKVSSGQKHTKKM